MYFFLPQKIISKKFLNSRSMPPGTKKRHYFHEKRKIEKKEKNSEKSQFPKVIFSTRKLYF